MHCMNLVWDVLKLLGNREAQADEHLSGSRPPLDCFWLGPNVLIDGHAKAGFTRATKRLFKGKSGNFSVDFYVWLYI